MRRLARRRRAAATSSDYDGRASRRAWSCSTSSTASRPRRPATSPCRWNCKAGKCGSCSAEINGKPRLMCMTRHEHASTPGETITVTPMQDLPGHQGPGHRRLVQLREGQADPAVQAAAARTPTASAGCTQEDVERVQEFRKCIECFLCQDVCHVIRDHEENKTAFAGPRFFIRLRRARHAPARHRRPARRCSRSRPGSGYCNITKCCTEVCPEHIHITDNAHHPAEGARGRQLRPARVAGAQVPRRPQGAGVTETETKTPTAVRTCRSST